MAAKQRKTWPGLLPLARHFLYGAQQGPKVKYRRWDTPTTEKYYKGMEKHYRWFRQDELVRSCITANAFYACMAMGFETVVELVDPGGLTPEQAQKKIEKDYPDLKAEIDKLNKAVNLDLILFIAQVKRSIYGKAGFEIVLDDNGAPKQLLPLQSDKLKPELDQDWNLTGFEYKGKKNEYEPREILYFLNLSLEADYEGLSDIEPVLDICQTRHNILREDIPEISKALWAPFLFLRADTSGLSAEEEEKVMNNLINAIKPGKRVAVNVSVEGEVVDLKPDIPGLAALLDKLELMILGNFKTPRFLVGKPVENRATAYAELEAYVQGPIANIQRYCKREIERQWYDPQTRRILDLKEDDSLPVVVKHRWNPIRTIDIYEMAKAVAALWGAHGMGAIGGKREKVWSMMGWDPAELEGGK